MPEVQVFLDLPSTNISILLNPLDGDAVAVIVTGISFEAMFSGECETVSSANTGGGWLVKSDGFVLCPVVNLLPELIEVHCPLPQHSTIPSRPLPWQM